MWDTSEVIRNFFSLSVNKFRKSEHNDLMGCLEILTF